MQKFLKTVIISVTLIFTICLSSCSDEPVKTQHSYFAMNTVVNITVNGRANIGVLEECERITFEIEKDISKTLPDSYVFKINNSIGTFELPTYVAELISDSFRYSKLTDSAFDITVQPVVKLWNLKDESFAPPQHSDVLFNLPYCGDKHFKIKDNLLTVDSKEAGIDLGGIGKGYALQKVTEYLDSLGLDGTVSFGGNIGVFGKKESGEPWNISIKDPFDTNSIIGVLKMEKGYLAVSGGYERYAEYDGKKYHHIIDPKTGYPSDSDIASVAVLTDNGAKSDALSTALFVMGKDKALKLYESKQIEFEAVLVMTDGEIIATDGTLISGKFLPYNK